MPLSKRDIEAITGWLQEQNIRPGDAVIKKIGRYYDLIVAWSGRINLISQKDLPRMIESHILDSLGPIDMIPPGARVLDIGSGAGLPGIPIAIVRGDLEIDLLESIHKKVLFLMAVKKEIALENIAILEGRLEDLSGERLYDFATIRALPKWESYLEQARKILKHDAKIIYYRRRGRYEAI